MDDQLSSGEQAKLGGGFDIHELSWYDRPSPPNTHTHTPHNKPLPFWLRLKRLCCCEFAVYAGRPRGGGSLPHKGYILSLRGWAAGHAICGERECLRVWWSRGFHRLAR